MVCEDYSAIRSYYSEQDCNTERIITQYVTVELQGAAPCVYLYTRQPLYEQQLYL